MGTEITLDSEMICKSCLRKHVSRVTAHGVRQASLERMVIIQNEAVRMLSYAALVVGDMTEVLA